jgi:phosphatidylglycerophosphatase A
MNVSKDTYSTTPTFKWVRQTASRTIAFGFGSGLSPVAPGTVGTLWAWAAFLVGEYFLSTEDFLWIIGCGTLLGCWVCGHVSEELGKKDFGGIVWDEIIAFWIILILIMPTSIWMQAIAFGLFRFFDAVKPGPIGMIDRHFKNLESNIEGTSSMLQIIWRGFGIMVDDLAAAFFTLLAVALIQKMIPL